MIEPAFERDAPENPAHPAWMEVDLDALAHNYREIRRLVGPETQIVASVKGNGYGVGIVESARVLERLGVCAIATGSFLDALAVRRAGMGIKIHMLPGNLPEGVEALLQHDLIPTVYNQETARAVSEAATRPTPIFIKVDAGLGRLGVFLEEAEGFVKEVAQLPRIVIEGLFTHLPFRTASGKAWALPRIRRFDDLVSRLAQDGYSIPITQSLASSGVMCQVETRCSAVCVGHLLYGGLARVAPGLADLSRFRSVLAAVRTRLIHVARYRADTTVGSAGNLTMRAGSSHGVVPIGRYDGYRPPVAGETAVMLVHGQRAPVLSVSQEYVTLDLTEIQTPQVGDEVVVLGESGGKEITIEEMAGWSGGIPLDILMAFSKRFPTVYLGGGE